MSFFFRRLGDRLSTQGGILLMVLLAALVLGLSIYGLSTSIGDEDDSSLSQNQLSGSTSTTNQQTTRQIVGFESRSLRVVPATGPSKTLCVAVAKTAHQLSTGMMHQESFGGLDGMMFVFEDDTTSPFYMANVKIPLSIAFFDGTGQYVSSTDMPICEVSADKCPRYPAARPFRSALETPLGGLGDLGVGPGANVTLDGPCT